MKLYYAETPNPRKPCAVAKYLDLSVEYVRIDFSKGEHKSPAYLKINPNGKVPTLVDGEFTLWESHAIMAYLADKAGSDLWPKDARQYDVLKWLNWATAHLSRHAGQLYFQNALKARFGLGDPDPALVEESLGFFRQFAGILNDHLKGRTWLVGDSLTIADFGVAPELPEAEAAKLPVGEFPEIMRWHDRLNSLPAWREPYPARTASAA